MPAKKNSKKNVIAWAGVAAAVLAAVITASAMLVSRNPDSDGNGDCVNNDVGGDVFCYPPTVPSSSAPRPVVDLAVEKPADNGTVDKLDDVHIRIDGAYEGEVWILIWKAGGSTVFPQGACDKLANGRSVCQNAQFGDDSDKAGTAFNATVVLVDRSEAREYLKYHRTGFRQGGPPVEPLASSPTITVHRR